MKTIKVKFLPVLNFLFLLATLFFTSCTNEDSADNELEEETNDLYGVWIRTNGPSGDETEIAIGKIPGEPENRVYMCESVGTTGLYKGYINGNTISWDNGMADASVRIVNGQLEFYYPSLSNSLPTMYDKGSWSGHCGLLGLAKIYVVYDPMEFINTNIVSVKLDDVILPKGKIGTHNWLSSVQAPPPSLPAGSSNPYLCMLKITYGPTLNGGTDTYQQAFDISSLQPGLNILKLSKQSCTFCLIPYANGVPSGNPASVSITDVSEITSNSFRSGGINIVSNGNEIIEKGVCWGTSQNPTRADNSVVSGSGEGDFTSIALGLNPLTTYYARAYVTILEKTYYSDEEISFTTQLGTLSIGQEIAGGIVVYILQPGDYGYDPNQQHGLISDLYDSSSRQWGCISMGVPTNIGTTSMEIGYGLQNSISIANVCPNSAAGTCINSTRNGYDDWYLPSLMEMQKLMNLSNSYNLNINQFVSYWTSTEYPGENTHVYTVGINGLNIATKDQERLFRLFRSF